MVCLVDDDSSTRKSLTRLLESDGFRVEAFSESTAFLEHLAIHPMAVVILNSRESGTGTALLAQLRAQSPATCVIFIIAAEDHRTREWVRNEGVFAILVKPLDDEEFLSAVRRAFPSAQEGKCR